MGCACPLDATEIYSTIEIQIDILYIYIYIYILTSTKAPISPSPNRTQNYITSTARATTRPSLQRTFLPASTDAFHPYLPTKHPLTKPSPHTKKHSTKADTTTHYSMNLQQQTDGKTDNATTSSGTILHLAKTPAPTSDTSSSP